MKRILIYAFVALLVAGCASKGGKVEDSDTQHRMNQTFQASGTPGYGSNDWSGSGRGY